MNKFEFSWITDSLGLINKLGWIRDRLVWLGMNWDELEWIGMDWDEMGLFGMDWDESGCIMQGKFE